MVTTKSKCICSETDSFCQIHNGKGIELDNYPVKIVIEHKGKKVETSGTILTSGKFCVIRHYSALLRNIEFAIVTVERLLAEFGYVKYTDEANYRLAITIDNDKQRYHDTRLQRWQAYCKAHGHEATIVADTLVLVVHWTNANGTKGSDNVACRTWQDVRDALGY